MNPDVVYAKTARGHEEIGRRTYCLPARMRALLIMVDGKTTASDFINRSASPDEATANIAALLDGGFIAVAAIGPSEAAACDTPVALDAVEQARKFMVRGIVGALGPDAAPFADRIAAARTMAALTELAPEYIDIIRTGSGDRKADAFRAGLIDLGVIAESSGSPAVNPPKDDEARRLADAKRAITRFLLDTLGPDADHFTGKVERAVSTAEIRQLATRHIEVIRAATGARKAEEFRQRVLAALNG